MAKISEVLKHAFEHHYRPEKDHYGDVFTWYMCSAVLRSAFNKDEKHAACEAIHRAMYEHVKEHGGYYAKRYYFNRGQNASLATTLRMCGQSSTSAALRAWHLRLIDKLESEGK